MTWRRLAVIPLLVVAVALPLEASGAAPAAPTYCATGVSHGPGGADPGSATLEACRYGLQKTGVTPNIAIARNGTAFVALTTGGVQRSIDHGAHWSYVPVPAVKNGDTHEGGGHGFVHVDPRTDRVYYLTSLNVRSCGTGNPLGPGSVLSWSDDLGRTWNGTTVSCNTYDWGRVVTGKAPKGSTYPSAIYFLGVGERPISGKRVVYRSLDGGATFQQMTDLAAASTEAGAAVTAPDGTIYFDYPEFIGFDPTRVADLTYPFQPQDTCKQMVAVSEDFGGTWRQQALPGSFACNELYGQLRVAVDKAGTVYAIWNDDLDNRVHMVTSRDKGHTWSASVDVMPPGATYNNSFANIVAGKAGHIFLALQAATSQLPNRAFIAPLPVGATPTYTYLLESFNGTSATPRFSSVRMDAENDPTYSNGASATEGEALVAMAPAGEGWAAWTRGTKSGPPLIGEATNSLYAARVVQH